MTYLPSTFLLHERRQSRKIRLTRGPLATAMKELGIYDVVQKELTDKYTSIQVSEKIYLKNLVQDHFVEAIEGFEF